MAATKTAFNKCKINMNLFPPTCLGQHCRVGLGTDSTWKVESVYLPRSGGWQVPSHMCAVHGLQWAVPVCGSLDPQ